MGIAYNPKVITDGLVFYVDAANNRSYPGTGTVWTDLVGENNGTLTNMETDGTDFSSANGGSLTFDGSDEYILLPDSVSELLGGASACTFSGWVKRNSTGTRDSIIDLTINSTASKLFVDFQADNTLRAGGRADSGDSFQSKVTTATFTDTTEFYYITAILDIENDDVQLWVNGVEQADTGSPSWSQTSFDADVGTRNTIGIAAGLLHPIAGQIGYGQIYNRTLTADEILQNYNSTKGRFRL